MIEQDKRESAPQQCGSRPRWLDLLRSPQTWGTIAAKELTDPVWFFVTDWFPIYLVAKGIKLEGAFVAY